MRRRPSRLIAAALAMGLTLALAGLQAAADQLPILFGGPFTLLDHEGRPRGDGDFRGRFLLLSFGYTFCPDICPTGLQTMTAALEEIGELAKRVQPAFISVDPARDTPDVLKDYVAHFDPRLIGLTGSESQVRQAAKAYRVHRRKVVLADAEGPRDYLVDHSSLTYLMGPDGGFVTLYPHGTRVADMVASLRRHLAGAESRAD